MKQKFGTKTKLSMRTSRMMFTFSVFDHTFSGRFGPKTKNCKIELKFCTNLIWICRIVLKICGVYFFCFSLEKIFSGKSAQKIKIASFSWNLVPRLIWICKFQWWCSLFLFLYLFNNFLGQLWSKNLKLFVQREIWYKD